MVLHNVWFTSWITRWWFSGNIDAYQTAYTRAYITFLNSFLIFKNLMELCLPPVTNRHKTRRKLGDWKYLLIFALNLIHLLVNHFCVVLEYTKHSIQPRSEPLWSYERHIATLYFLYKIIQLMILQAVDKPQQKLRWPGRYLDSNVWICS